jgi:hypothetical protein
MAGSVKSSGFWAVTPFLKATQHYNQEDRALNRTRLHFLTFIDRNILREIYTFILNISMLYTMYNLIVDYFTENT